MSTRGSGATVRFNPAYLHPDDLRELGVGDDSDPRRGVSTNKLVDTDRHYQAINAMPTMSGLPVKVMALTGPTNDVMEAIP